MIREAYCPTLSSGARGLLLCIMLAGSTTMFVRQTLRTPEPRLKFIQVGVGRYGSQTLKAALEQGFQCVGAITRQTGLGQDIGAFLRLGRTIGLTITNDLESLLARTHADISIVTTRSTLHDIYPSVSRLLRAKINVVTLAEEAWDSWPTSPALTRNLDMLARRMNVTISGSGFQDPFMGQIILDQIKRSIKVEKLVFLQTMNLDRYGIAPVVFRELPVDKELVLKQLPWQTQCKFSWPFMTGCTGLYWLASALGWNVTNITLSNRKETDGLLFNISATLDMPHATLDNACGIDSSFLFKLGWYGTATMDTVAVRIWGVPETSTMTKVDVESATVAGITSQLQNVIRARSGYVLTHEL